jgi:hypothetical protein
MMVAVAAVALALTLWQVMSRWRTHRLWAGQRVAYHTREEVEFNRWQKKAARYVRFVEQFDRGTEGEWFKGKWAILGAPIYTLGATPGDERLPTAEARRDEAALWRQAADEYAKTASYHRAMKAKYYRSYNRPWERVLPDPPYPVPGMFSFSMESPPAP